MKDRTATQLKAVINKYLKKWKGGLFLGMWTINFNIRDYLHDDGGSYLTAATCDSSWKYFTADLDFSLTQLKDMEEKEIEKIIIHELLHIVVNEMREDGIEHEERVTSHLQMIMSWMDNARP
jgi:predicted SprT family Zn-dependent metalloprotease